MLSGITSGGTQPFHVFARIETTEQLRDSERLAGPAQIRRDFGRRRKDKAPVERTGMWQFELRTAASVRTEHEQVEVEFSRRIADGILASSELPLQSFQFRQQDLGCESFTRLEGNDGVDEIR